MTKVVRFGPGWSAFILSALLVMSAILLPACARGQGDDPLAGDQPKATTSGGGVDREKGELPKGAPTSEVNDANSLAPALESLKRAEPLQYVYVLVAAIVCYLVGWLILRLVVPSESPGSAGCFGCFTGAATFLGFLTMVLFGWILPAALPEWLVWSVVALLALGLIVFAVRLTGARRFVAIVVGLLVLGGLVFLWMNRKSPTPVAESSGAKVESTSE